MRMDDDETSPATYSMRMEDAERALQSRPGSGATREVFLCHILIRDLRSEIRAGDCRVQTERMELWSRNLRSSINFLSGMARLQGGREGFRSQRPRIGMAKWVCISTRKIYTANG